MLGLGRGLWLISSGGTTQFQSIKAVADTSRQAHPSSSCGLPVP